MPEEDDEDENGDDDTEDEDYRRHHPHASDTKNPESDSTIKSILALFHGWVFSF